MSRIRANQITNQAADGAPTVQHGLIIAGVSTFTGSVSIGGTLTYEDVTNIDSVGIITARDGLKVLGGGANVVGVVTATSFVGSGANLTGITQTTINNNADNRVITGSGSANTLNGEANLTFDGTKLNIATGGAGFRITRNSQYIELDGNFGNGGDQSLATSAGFRIQTGGVGNSYERLRITNTGLVGIGDNSPDRELVVKNASSNSTIKIEASNSHTSQLFFSDTDAENVARIGVFHGSGQSSSNAMIFETGGTSRMAIKSDGKIGINQTNPIGTLDVYDGSFVLSKPNDSGNERNWRFLNNNIAAGNLGLQVSTAAGGSTFSNIIEVTRNGAIGLAGANYGSSGQVLTSQGGSSAPTWTTPSGKVVNYDSTIVTAAGSASLSQGSYSNNIIGLSYAAASSSNKLLLIASVSVGYQHGQSVASRLTVSNSGITGATGDASGNRRRATTAAWIDSGYQVTNMTLVYEHSSPSTSAVTYGVQLGQSDNGTQTVYWNRSTFDENQNYRIRAVTTLTIIELEG